MTKTVQQNKLRLVIKALFSPIAEFLEANSIKHTRNVPCLRGVSPLNEPALLFCAKTSSSPLRLSRILPVKGIFWYSRILASASAAKNGCSSPYILPQSKRCGGIHESQKSIWKYIGPPGKIILVIPELYEKYGRKFAKGSSLAFNNVVLCFFWLD